MKRIFDITVALGLLPFAIPACILAMGLLRLELRANPIFRQTRVGYQKKHFTIFKLRTMRLDTINAASHEVHPTQITRIGQIVRTLKIDELPQILNVLKGDMSFVGPRPCLPTQEELVNLRDALGVYSLHPGITGPAQLAGIDMSEPERLARADAVYLTKMSLMADAVMVVRTFLGLGSGDAAVTRLRE